MHHESTTREIPLSHGLVALVDAADYEWLAQCRWLAVRRATGIWYAQNPALLLMHRLILGTPPRVRTDHINRNGLDNRRANLRLATASQNGANSRRGRNNHSGFKGVCWDPERQQWTAKIMQNRVTYNLGRFATAEAAAAAYDAAAVARFGEYAAPNRTD